MPESFNKENQNQNQNEENDIIYEEFEFLKEKLSHLKEYPKLIKTLINNKIKISKNQKYRKKLFQILCSK